MATELFVVIPLPWFAVLVILLKVIKPIGAVPIIEIPLPVFPPPIAP
jgi:hypothetical protein